MTGENSNGGLRIGDRFCSTYDKKQLMSFGVALRIADMSSNMKKADMCKKIAEHARKKRTELRNKAKTAENQKVANRQRRLQAIRNEANREKANKERRAQQMANEKRVEAMKRVGFNRNNIRKELPKLFGAKFMKEYGNKVNNQMLNQLADFLAVEMPKGTYEMSKRNKTVPLKASVNIRKQNIVNEWKVSLSRVVAKTKTAFKTREAAKANLQKLVGKNVNVTNDLLNKYITFANTTVRRNNTVPFNQAKQTWLRLERTYGTLKPTTAPLRRRLANVETEEI